MKIITGIARVKPESNYIYKDFDLKITGISQEYRNGSGQGIYPDGSREYRICLRNTPFQERVKASSTVIHDKELDILELFETIELPLNENETLELINFSKNHSSENDNEILKLFLKSKTGQHTPPKQDPLSIYSDEEYEEARKCKPFKVAIYESERGWGRKLDDHMICLSLEDALQEALKLI